MAEPPNIKSVEIGKHLSALRTRRGWTQTELAARAGLKRPQIAYFESGQRTPGLGHLLRLAQALDAPLQQFLSGEDRPGSTWAELAFELRQLGFLDLWIPNPRVPGAFRHPEEVVVLAVSFDTPEARVVEGLPTVLAWGRWNVPLLRAFARAAGRPVARRVAWLADVALALERAGGMPGGCPGREDLARFVKLVKVPPRGAPWDGLGRPAPERPTSAIWKRWRINYGATVEEFRHRAQRLLVEHETDGRPLPARR